MRKNFDLIAIACLVGAMALWASTFVAIKVALVDTPPFVLIFLRLILGSMFFLAFWKHVVRESLVVKDRWLLLLMSLFEPCLYFLFETTAMLYTTASQAGIIFAFLPILILVFSYLMLREKPSSAQVTGGVLAAVGVLLLVISGSPSRDASAPALGNFLQVLAMASAAIYTVLLKRLSGTYPPFFLAGAQSFTGAIFFLPFAAYDMGNGVSFGVESAVAVLYLGIAVTAGAYILFNIGISRVSVSEGALYFNLVPIFTVAFSIAFLGEHVGITQILAMTLVVSGVAIGLVKKKEAVVPMVLPPRNMR